MDYELSLDIQKVKYAREAGAVDRCHTIPKIGHYDVAQHSFNILSMLRILYPNVGPALFWACHCHDLAERLTGDIPAPVKWVGIISGERLKSAEKHLLQQVGFPHPPLTSIEHDILKGLDMLELLMWCFDQVQLGNKTANVMIRRIHNWFNRNYSELPGPIAQLYESICSSEWELMPDLGD